eukprot:TRINITY_DN2638_c0_g1_i1.p1 TRINITY_DN2638_c0_g1~~TRINITY_DN2638_c0_g1_i1.p1  ORF type:complete len:226 (+),score=63.28 TRINITY_DN2638_c0_g1_i1:32-679(+)
MVIPIKNQHRTSRWNQRAYDIHKKKLNKIKGSVDNAKPQQYSHIKKNHKRTIKEEERCEQIFKENQLLLTKIAIIKSSGGSVKTHQKTHRKQETLHEAARRREFERIDRENARLLNRIKEVNPTYKREEWKTHGKRHDQYLKQIGGFPIDSTELEGHPKRSRKLAKAARKRKENKFDDNDEDEQYQTISSIPEQPTNEKNVSEDDVKIKEEDSVH